MASKRFKLLPLLVVISTLSLSAQEKNPLLGRWNITMDYEGKEQPSWLEIHKSGHETLIGRFVYAFGSARPVSHIKTEEGKFSFSIPRQWEPEGEDMSFEGSYTDEMLQGTMRYVDGKTYNWAATRAPKLAYNENPNWGEAIDLFNGTSLKGWELQGEGEWVVEDGLLKNVTPGANLISTGRFKDFKVHIEFRYPEGSNSGIYLRGRYEVQIADNKGMEPDSHLFAGVYGFLTPNEMVAKDPGEWQEYDITLIGRRVTVVANGKTVINDQNIPGMTGGALDNKEAEPGPLYIQGDHGPVEFRKIVLTPVKEAN